MTACELRSLLYDYCAILRSPGGSEKIGFALEQHIEKLRALEMYSNEVCLLDLPRYQEPAPRTLVEVIEPFARVEPFPICTPSTS